MELVQFNKAKKELALATDIDEVKDIRDKAEALRLYAKQHGETLEMQNGCAEIKLRAERRAGEILKEQDKDTGGGDTSGGRRMKPPQEPPKLSDLGISKTQSSHWQQVADIPEKVFEKHISDIKIKKNELTSKGVQVVAKKIKTEKRNKEKREAIAKEVQSIKKSDRWNIYQADIKDWQSQKQYDFIITDPPYKKEFLPLYETLSIKASEWLKDGGLLIAMCGQSHLNIIYEMMSKNINYYWTAAYLTPGQPTPIRQRNVNTTWKPLLMFSKGKYTGKIFGDVFKSDGNDKSHHEWGQSISGMFSIIKMICLENQSILDPFCGAGTTGIAALMQGCLFDGVELEKKNVEISTARLADYDAKKI